MAQTYQIVVLSEAEARSWMKEVEMLNDETQQALTTVSNSLTDISSVSSGDLVDQLTNAGNTLFSGITEVFNAMTGVVNAVGGVLDSLANLVGTVTDAVKSIGGIFGL